MWSFILVQNTSLLVHNTSLLVHNTSSLVHNTSSLVHNTSLLVHNTSLLVQNTSSLVHNTSLLVQNTSSLVQNTSSLVQNTSSLVQNTSSFSLTLVAIAPEKFALAVTPYFASLLDPEDPLCPLRLQVIPREEELLVTPCQPTLSMPQAVVVKCQFKPILCWVTQTAQPNCVTGKAKCTLMSILLCKQM